MGDRDAVERSWRIQMVEVAFYESRRTVLANTEESELRLLSSHRETNSASQIAHHPVVPLLRKRTKPRRGEVIGEQVISSHLVRHGTDHPSRRRHVRSMQ